MNAGMAEVIAAHSGHSVKLSPQGRFTIQCHGCGESTSVSRVTPPRSGSPIHAAHVAEELAKAGYGNVREAKEEAFTDAVAALRDRGKWARSDHGPYVVKTGYDEDGYGNAAQDVDEWYADWLEQFPYREPSHGVD